MNLILDIGNTRTKVGLFEKDNLIEVKSFGALEDVQAFVNALTIENAIISSVKYSEIELEWITVSNRKIWLTNTINLPISNKYKTPTTLGVDRIAAACGAWSLYPNENTLVIDTGTCVNYEFTDQYGNYWGGAISPGINMRFQAMNTFTSKLPLVKADSEVSLIGNSTETCMQSGVINGLRAEINGIIDQYKEKYLHLRVIMCGGDYTFFENNLKHPIFVAPELVLRGLNSILLHHVK